MSGRAGYGKSTCRNSMSPRMVVTLSDSGSSGSILVALLRMPKMDQMDSPPRMISGARLRLGYGVGGHHKDNKNLDDLGEGGPM
jgi:hypothetical protein